MDFIKIGKVSGFLSIPVFMVSAIAWVVDGVIHESLLQQVSLLAFICGLVLLLAMSICLCHGIASFPVTREDS